MEHYGTQRLVVKMGRQFNQAGEDSEQNVDKLARDCTIKIQKIQTIPTRRIKYAVCIIM